MPNNQILSCVGCGFYDPDYGCMSRFDWECPQYEGPLPWEDEEDHSHD